MVRLYWPLPLGLAQVRTNQQPEVLVQRPVFPRGCPRRKPELPYQQHLLPAGPFRQLSFGQWVLSERLSIELADTDWTFESALAQCRQLRSLRGIQRSLEKQKCSSPGRRLHRLPNFQPVRSLAQTQSPLKEAPQQKCMSKSRGDISWPFHLPLAAVRLGRWFVVHHFRADGGTADTSPLLKEGWIEVRPMNLRVT
jgi:hypothetical protein